MAKKKKSKGSGNPVLDALTEMLSVMSPEEKMQLMVDLKNIAQSGSLLDDVLEDTYTYQRPDYTKEVKPLAGYLQTLLCAALPSDVLHAYEVAHNEMVSLSHQEQEDAMFNFFMRILADGLTRSFTQEENATSLPMVAGFQLVDDFKLTGLFDIILELLKQNMDFYEFYFGTFEDTITLILAHVGVGHLDELKETIKTEGFLPEAYPIIFKAVVQMAVENPFCRLQVLVWAADVLKSCVEVTIPAMTMDRLVEALAEIKAVDLLPLVKDIYKQFNIQPVIIKGGFKEITKLLSKGTDERIVGFADFKELLNLLLEGEDCNFDVDNYWFNDDDDEEDDDGDNWFIGADDEWDADDERDADTLFYKECGYKPGKPKANPAKPKAKPARKGKRKYALILDVTLKGSPRKVYRQLVVPSDLTLNHLGEILVRAVGWEGYHLNQFIAGKTYYAEPSDDAWVVGMQEDASKCTIGSLLSRVKSKIKWEYDFGDSWVHEITLVEKQAVDDNETVKVELLKGSGACPPEDCGGVCGYRHLLNVLKNPADEEYEEMIEWLGGGFDPKSFSLTAARNKVKGYLQN